MSLPVAGASREFSRVNPYEPEPGTEGKTVWFVASAREETLRATIALESDRTLLGGNADIAVLLHRTELGEESVEVYAVVPDTEGE